DVFRRCSFFSYLKACPLETFQKGYVADCAYCTPKPLNCFTDRQVREIAEILLWSVAADNDEQEIMQNSCQSPAVGVLEILGGSWDEWAKWVNAGNEGQELEIGKDGEAEQDDGNTERISMAGKLQDAYLGPADSGSSGSGTSTGTRLFFNSDEVVAREAARQMVDVDAMAEEFRCCVRV
ncbi:MAG: hypothetical protein LQ340_002281, partial [Diploschistes diacapsis]